MKRGIFVISLDFELYWGMRDIISIDDYKENLLGVRQVIPQLLSIFQEFNIHATWATVGFLFFQSKDQLLKNLPTIQPNYLDPSLSPYTSIKSIGKNEKEDPFHYGQSLLKEIIDSTNQEIGTHTLSHYYCLEKGQNIESFQEDLKTAIRIGLEQNLKIKSLVFPRNQFNSQYLSVCKELGITSFRGNELSWIYQPISKKNEMLLKRAIRFLDAYINLSGHNTYSIKELKTSSSPLNIPSSRFLRPYNRKLKVFEKIRLQRILNSMTFSAKNQQVYHLWWHPHNFGSNLEENLSFLRSILSHYCTLKKQYGMESLNMGELADILLIE